MWPFGKVCEDIVTCWDNVRGVFGCVIPWSVRPFMHNSEWIRDDSGCSGCSGYSLVSNDTRDRWRNTTDVLRSISAPRVKS